MFVSGGKTTRSGIDEYKELIPILAGADNVPMRFASPTLSCDAESAALRTEIMALRRSHGDADPGIVIRLAHQRVAAATTILEMKAMAEEVAEFRDHLETLRLALHLERLRAEYKANFDPDQPRDEVGRWTDGGGRYAEDESGFIVDDFGSIVSLASDITGFTKHGINQAITRGVSPFDIIDALKNPLEIVAQSGGRLRYEGGGAVVVLNSNGEVITVWRKSR